MTDTLKVIQLELGDMANYSYLVADTQRGEAAIIDPQDDIAPFLKAAEKDSLKITAVLLTHGHYDHVGGAEALAARFNIPVYLSEHEASFYTPRCRNMKRTADGEKIVLGGISIECIHTPGHTPGCQCFLMNGHLFTGDTLFVDAVGRTDLPGGSSAVLFKSLQRIKRLPDATIIWPGHNYGAVSHQTLLRLKEDNPFLASDDERMFRDFLG